MNAEKSCRENGVDPFGEWAQHDDVRMLFSERRNIFGKGANWPTLAGWVVALMFLATSARANPQLDTSNPISFFTNVATALFEQMDLRDFNGDLVTVTNIPIYEDPAVSGVTNVSYYTPAVHRVLQLAANMFDATTNRLIGDGSTNYPTVFRPIFSSQNGIARIIGYQEVTDPSDAFLPMLYVSNFIKVNQPTNGWINMYGVPWVIGARKGFPNFNEFSMENPLTVTRQLSFTNIVPAPPWTTNQIYSFAITNSFGLELWNSYTNLYGRPLRLVVSNELSIMVTNEDGMVLLMATNIPYGADVVYPSWAGWGVQLSDSSFKVPLFAASVFTNGIYDRIPPYFHPISWPYWTSTFVPHLWMSVQFNLRYVMIDTTANRVVDFVNISSVQPPVDIGRLLNNNNPSTSNWVPDYTTLDGQWNSNQAPGSTLQFGILNQIEVSKGDRASIWTDPSRIVLGQFFYNRLNNGGTNFFVAPYTPSRVIVQRISFQANDPLVHYTESDLVSTNGAMANYNLLAVGPVAGPPLANLTNLNSAYQPWGGRHLRNGASLSPNSYDLDLRVKDPGVQQSDDWNFPTGASLGFEWLGRVHRGTPWQTVYLKPSDLSLAQWKVWSNDKILFTNDLRMFSDGAFSYPSNDWRFASLWARWLNTNDLATLFSINNDDTNAWAARLDGFTAFTNSAVGQLDAIVISSNSPQAGVIAQAIQAARVNADPMSGPLFSSQRFKQVGDVLAVSALSVGSPFLHTNGMNNPGTLPKANGISDEAMEIIPAQLLPLLHVDSFGQIAPLNDGFRLSFSGDDGHPYAVQVSSNLLDWVSISTNSPSEGSFGITNSVSEGRQYYRSVLLY